MATLPLYEQIKQIFQNTEFLSIDGEFLTGKIFQAIEKLDKTFIIILIQNKTTKEHFFEVIEDAYILNQNKLFDFFNAKEYFDSSFTSYTNKIGLIKKDSFIKKFDDVVLAFPYKDCVLEGGMSSEDVAKKEVFYNSIISKEEIDRLFEPKVLTNIKKFDKEGQSNPTEISMDDNLILKGNNLLALHSLKQRYAGQIKLIYIDPPYNTGNDGFKYNDRFNHSTWLTFMKNRLEVAWELLRDDGVIFIQIDNNETHYLKILLDEVFGRDNYQREIIWVLKGVSGYKSLINNFVRGHETILFYSKTKNFDFNKLYLEYSQEQLARFSSTDENGKKYKTITKDRKLYLDDAKGLPISDVWDDIASFQTIVNSPEITGFSTQKPEKLIERVINSVTKENDIVLDYHLGSGTTCAVAHKMNRRYIGIEQMDYIETIAVERMKKVIGGEQGGISKSVNWKGGGSFVYAELKIIDTFNEEDTIGRLNDNMRYLPIGEIDDESYAINEAEKKLNKQFYGVK